MKWLPRLFIIALLPAPPVISFDLTATAIAAAGADAAALEGVDLAPFVTGKKPAAPHDVLFWRNRTRSNNYAARQGDWKFVHSTQGSESPGPRQTPGRDMLFHLATDIGEQHDLAAEQPDKLAALKKLYEAWSAEMDADYHKLGMDTSIAPPVPSTTPNKPAKP